MTTTYFPEDVLASTEDTCRREPLAARTRLALLRLEKDGHRAGWDDPLNAPAIFRFDRDPVRGFVSVHPARALTVALRHACDVTGGDVGQAMQLVADATEGARGALHRLGLPMNMDACRPEQVGYRFYGYAARHEGWTLHLDLDPDSELPKDIEDALRRKAIDEHPDRIEVRMVNLHARDGLTWWCLRRRRLPPAEVVVMRPEADFEGVGLVMNALGRMTNAAAGNISPVPDTGGSAEEMVDRVRRSRR